MKAEFLETISERTVQSVGLEKIIKQEVQELKKELCDRKNIIRDVVEQNELAGFAFVRLVPEEDDDTVIMSGQVSDDNSDFDSDCEDETCYMCGVQDAQCINCSIRKTEITILAAQRVFDHLCRYKAETCGVSAEIAVNVVGNRVAREPESMFAAMCIAGAYKQADLIQDMSLRNTISSAIMTVQDVVDTIVPLCSEDSLLRDKVLMEKMGYYETTEIGEVDSATKDDGSGSSSSLHTPSPPRKKRCFGTDQAINVDEDSFINSGDWWADSTNVLPNSVVSSNNPVCDLFDDSDSAICKRLMDFGTEEGEDDNEDFGYYSDSENTALDVLPTYSYSRMKTVMCNQARELLALKEREKTCMEALSLKHAKIQEVKNAEHKLRRDKVNSRHYSVYLEVSGLGNKLN